MKSIRKELLYFFISAIVLATTLAFSKPSLSQGIDIQRIQYVLNAIGYDAGAEDGVFGPTTESALKLFQDEHDIPITGLLDEETVYLIRYRESGLVTPTTEPSIDTSTTRETTPQGETLKNLKDATSTSSNVQYAHT